MTLAVVIMSTYGTAIKIFTLSASQTSLDFYARWAPVRSGRLAHFLLCFPLVGCRNFEFLPHATRLQKCVLRLLADDISIEKLSVSLLASLQLCS